MKLETVKAKTKSERKDDDASTSAPLKATFTRMHHVLPSWTETDLSLVASKLDETRADQFDKHYESRLQFDKLMLDFLTLSRVGKFDQPEQVNFSQAMDQAVAKVDAQSGFAIHQSFKSPSVFAGQGDIVLLLHILIENAIAHHDRREGHIYVESWDGSGRVHLSVKDDGPGIPPRHQQRVFEMMSSLNPPDKIGNDGMGLVIARKIVTHYGGSIRAESPDDLRGAKIIATFPLKT